MQLKLFWLVLLAAISNCWGYLRMWEHEDQRGSSKTLYSDYNDFRRLNGRWNDKVSSVQARGESWELYTHVDYEGRRMVVPDGGELNVAHNDRYSSARPICVYSENPETAKLIVYEHWYFRGEEREFLTESSNVGSRWNDRISSVKAVKGDWEIYQHFEFEGRREVISEGTSKNIRHNDHASSIRPLCSTYKMTCKLNKVKVIDNGQVIPTLKRTEIIGSQDGGSCLGPATHTLTLSNADTVEERTTIEISQTDEINWSVTRSVTVQADAKFLGSGTSFKAEVSAGVGGARSITTTHSKSFSTGNEKLVGINVEYTTPGAALIYGTVEHFTIKNANVPVEMEMICPDGTTRKERSTAKMNSVTYPSSHFWSLNGQFNKEACDEDYSLPFCAKRVRQTYSHSTFNLDEIKEAFEACFNDGKGKLGK